MLFLAPLFVFIFGMILGSFATAIAHREAAGVTWWSMSGKAARSFCPSCNKALSAIDLIPVFSWLWLRGKCRQCAKPISLSYILIELACALGALSAYLSLGPTLGFAFILCALPFLAALLLVDIRHMILPNRLVLIVALIGAARIITLTFMGRVDGGIVADHFLAALIFGALALALGWLMGLLLKKEALGMGDVKFFAVAGLWLGLSALPQFCMMAGALGVVFAVLWQIFTKEKLFPFGPALIVSLYLLVLFDGSLLG